MGHKLEMDSVCKFHGLDAGKFERHVDVFFYNLIISILADCQE